MALTSGFYNSKNGDRKYNAEQMSAIFDGIINDGVLANIGTAFAVTATTGNTVNVGIGRAWFNSTWINNDSILSLTLDESSVLLNRIDAVIIEVDRSDNVRAASIKVKKGTEASSPTNPTMTNTEFVHQYPLAYIYRGANTSSITQGNITNAVGTSSCPYVTGILQVQSIDNIVAQWQAQWIEWYVNETATTEAQADAIIAEWNQWYANETSSVSSETTAWLSQMQADITEWFNALQIVLDDNTAVELGNAVVDLQNKFSDLATNRAVYENLEDNNGNEITDNYGNPIIGRTVFPINTSSGGMEANGLVTYATFEEQIDLIKKDIEETNQNIYNVQRIGDTVTTCRTDLGDNWLLCNGSNISVSDYPELAELLSNPNSSDVWNVSERPLSASQSSSLASGWFGIKYLNGYYLVTSRANQLHYTNDIDNGSFSRVNMFESTNSNYLDPMSATYVNGKYYIAVKRGVSLDSYGQLGLWIYSSSSLSTAGTSTNLVTAPLSPDTEGVGDYIDVGNLLYNNGYLMIPVAIYINGTSTASVRIYYSSGSFTQWNYKEIWVNEDYCFDSYPYISYENGNYILCYKHLYKNNSKCYSSARIAYSTSITGNWSLKDLYTVERDDVEYYPQGNVVTIKYSNGIYAAVIYSYTYANSQWVTNHFIAYASDLSNTFTLKNVNSYLTNQGSSIKIGSIGAYNDTFFFVADDGSILTSTNLNDFIKISFTFSSSSYIRAYNAVCELDQRIILYYGWQSSKGRFVIMDIGTVPLPTISLSDSAYTYIKALE